MYNYPIQHRRDDNFKENHLLLASLAGCLILAPILYIIVLIHKYPTYAKIMIATVIIKVLNIIEAFVIEFQQEFIKTNRIFHYILNCIVISADIVTIIVDLIIVFSDVTPEIANGLDPRKIWELTAITNFDVVVIVQSMMSIAVSLMSIIKVNKASESDYIQVPQFMYPIQGFSTHEVPTLENLRPTTKPIFKLPEVNPRPNIFAPYLAPKTV